MSISSKIQSLITAANSVTGESRTDLTACVQDLKDGYGGGGGLPAEYEAVEYIEQGEGGNAYISTDYYIKASDNIITKLYIPSSHYVAWQTVFGAIDSSQQFPQNCIKACMFALDSASPRLAINRGGGGSSSSQSSLINREFELRIINGLPLAYFNYSSNMITIGSSSNTNIQDCVRPCAIFSNANTKLRMYYFYAIGSDGALNFQLVPCYRKSDNEIGMYDIVAGTFYTNAGTGSFACYPAPPTP